MTAAVQFQWLESRWPGFALPLCVWVFVVSPSYHPYSFQASGWLVNMSYHAPPSFCAVKQSHQKVCTILLMQRKGLALAMGPVARRSSPKGPYSYRAAMLPFAAFTNAATFPFASKA